MRQKEIATDVQVWYKSILYEVSRRALELAARVYFRIEVVGSAKIPRSGALILACNHASFLDPLLIGPYIPRQVSFIAKEELFFPPLGWYLSRMGTESIRRGHADTGAMRAAIRILARNDAVLLFPEGTRTRSGGLLPAKAGLGKIVMVSRAVVVPAWIGGSFLACPKGSRFPRPTQIRMAFGDPIPWDAWRGVPDRREGYQEISDRVMKDIFTLSEQYAIKSTRPFLEESRRNLFSDARRSDPAGASTS